MDYILDDYPNCEFAGIGSNIKSNLDYLMKRVMANIYACQGLQLTEFCCPNTRGYPHPMVPTGLYFIHLNPI